MTTDAKPGLVIGDDLMTCGPHEAKRDGERWEVVWLPGRRLDRNGAITAVHLADQISKDASMYGRGWPFIVAWAGELGLSGQEAVALCTGERMSVDD